MEVENENRTFFYSPHKPLCSLHCQTEMFYSALSPLTAKIWYLLPHIITFTISLTTFVSITINNNVTVNVFYSNNSTFNNHCKYL